MKVTIFGYTELFAANPAVAIYKGNELLGHVERNGKIELEISCPCELVFRCSVRSAKCKVDSDMGIVLSFNRAWGTLSATPVVSQEAAQQTITAAKSSDKKRIIVTVAIIGGVSTMILFMSFIALLVAYF